MSLLDSYFDLCTAHDLSADHDQILTVKKLDLLIKRLESQKKWFSFLPQRWLGFQKPVRGLYIYGGVGRGKTMIMDLFFRTISIEKKKRYHFHEFMRLIHHRLKELSSQKLKAHPLKILARDIAKQSYLLCFDEFHFKDITDAMLLKRLVSFLWQEGIVIVATSNFHPEDLYENGYQRVLIVPFLKKMTKSFILCPLNGDIDYRQNGHENVCATQQKKLTIDAAAAGKQKLWDQFQKHIDYEHTSELPLHVNGRTWRLPCFAKRSLFVSFETLCGDTVGSQDYLALTKHIDSLYMWGVIALDDESLDKIKRFITLIDILYDKDINLYIASTVNPEKLYVSGRETVLFSRTKSRLHDMLLK